MVSFRVPPTPRFFLLSCLSTALHTWGHNPQDTWHPDQPCPLANPFVFPLEMTLCGRLREKSILAAQSWRPSAVKGTPPGFLAGEDPRVYGRPTESSCFLSGAQGSAVSGTKHGQATDNFFLNADPHRLIVRNFSKIAMSGLSILIAGFCLLLGLPNFPEGHEKGCSSEVTSCFSSFNAETY